MQKKKDTRKSKENGLNVYLAIDINKSDSKSVRKTQF